MKVTVAFRETYQFLFRRISSNPELPDNPTDLLCHFGTTAVSCVNRGVPYETTEGEKLPMRPAEQLVCKLKKC